MPTQQTNPQPPPPLFVTTGEFSAMTSLSATTIRRMCDRGDLAAIVISERGDRRIPWREVERLLAEADATRTGGRA